MKSVLVIDTPNSCVLCPVSCYSEYWKEYHCCGREYYRTIDNYDWQRKQMCKDDIRPEWCPLLPLPEKLKGNNSIYYQWGDYEDGWNHCIDAILGEQNE